MARTCPDICCFPAPTRHQQSAVCVAPRGLAPSLRSALPPLLPPPSAYIRWPPEGAAGELGTRARVPHDARGWLAGASADERGARWRAASQEGRCESPSSCSTRRCGAGSGEGGFTLPLGGRLFPHNLSLAPQRQSFYSVHSLSLRAAAAANSPTVGRRRVWEAAAHERGGRADRGRSSLGRTGSSSAPPSRGAVSLRRAVAAAAAQAWRCDQGRAWRPR